MTRNSGRKGAHVARIERLEDRTRGLVECVRIAASHFHSMAEGFEKSREPSKAAACHSMAALMEDQL
jgi:hypothetical protein